MRRRDTILDRIENTREPTLLLNRTNICMLYIAARREIFLKIDHTKDHHELYDREFRAMLTLQKINDRKLESARWCYSQKPITKLGRRKQGLPSWFYRDYKMATRLKLDDQWQMDITSQCLFLGRGIFPTIHPRDLRTQESVVSKNVIWIISLQERSSL